MTPGDDRRADDEDTGLGYGLTSWAGRDENRGGQP